MRYALLDDTGIVTNVIELEPDNHCTDHDEPGDDCLKWHAPGGIIAVPAGDGPNTHDPQTRVAGRGDRAVKVTGPRAAHRPYDFEPVVDLTPPSVVIGG